MLLTALRDFYDAIDLDQSGAIDPADLAYHMTHHFEENDVTERIAQDMIHKFSKGEGALNFKDFVSMMTEGDLDYEGFDALDRKERESLLPAAIAFDENARAEKLEESLAERERLVEHICKAWGFDAKQRRRDALLKKYPMLKRYVVLSMKSKRLQEQPWFISFMVGAILLAGALVGAQVEAYHPGDKEPLPAVIGFLDTLVLAVFTLEIAVKVVGEGLNPLRYFKDAWNKFDFFIVFACYAFMLPFMPNLRSLIALLRLLRLLRLLKLVKALPQLRIIVESLMAGFSSISFVVIILFIFYYIYAHLGLLMFQQNDPAHYGSLQTAMFTTFRLATLDGWSDLL
jgi:Ca2+-binding EF-hand superfamily protein